MLRQSKLALFAVLFIGSSNVTYSAPGDDLKSEFELFDRSVKANNLYDSIGSYERINLELKVILSDSLNNGGGERAKAISDFFDLLHRGLDAFNGDATSLSRIQSMLKNETASIKTEHIYKEFIPLNPKFDTDTLSLDNSELVMGEYERVSKLVGDDIRKLDAEIGSLSVAEVQWRDKITRFKQAESNGREVEKLFGELAFKDPTKISGFDKMWFDMAAYIDSELTARWNASEGVLSRIRERKKVLEAEKLRLKNMKEISDALWYWEAYRAGTKNSSMDTSGIDALKQGKGILDSTRNASQREIRDIRIEAEKKLNLTNQQVEELRGRAKALDEASNRNGQLQMLLGLARSGVDIGGAAIGSGSDTSSSETMKPTPGPSGRLVKTPETKKGSNENSAVKTTPLH